MIDWVLVIKVGVSLILIAIIIGLSISLLVDKFSKEDTVPLTEVEIKQIQRRLDQCSIDYREND